jgi:1-acyl-sn-glycerol-3-phosphate acyltransferase
MNPNQASLVFLLAAALAPWGWAIWALRRSPYTPWQSFWYFINVLYARLLWRAEVPRNLPVGSEQGAIIVANHRSSIDPWFVQLAAGRVVHWMVAKEYFDVPLVGTLLRVTEAIPTRRGGQDTAATRAAIRYASSGQLVGILPEGRINVTDQLLLPGRPGAAMIALATRVPLIPCYIHGSPFRGTVWSPFVTPAHVRVAFGPPIDLDKFRGEGRDPRIAAEVTLHLLKEIARLAGRDDFQPQLAGRRWLPGKEKDSADRAD